METTTITTGAAGPVPAAATGTSGPMYAAAPTEPEAGRGSIFSLLKTLTSDTKAFFQEELRLAKTEVSEKVSRLTRNATALAMGGLVAYAGAIVFLLALGVLLAWAFSAAGANPALSGFLGLGVVGLLVAGVGVALLMKGLKTLKEESLAPERTLQTLQEFKGRTVSRGAAEEVPPDLSAEQLQGRIEQRENRMGETLDELGRRLSPSHLNAEVKHRIQRNPYRAGLVAMVIGLAGGLILRRRWAS